MKPSGFRRIFWGFLFTMLDFRIQGIDILPDIAGYILFFLGLSILASRSINFRKTQKYCIPLIVLSVFSIYQIPSNTGANYINPTFGTLSFIIGIAAIVLDLMLVYNLCMGIGELAYQYNNREIEEESERRWRQYLVFFILSFGVVILAIIPPLLILGIIAVAVYGIVIIVYMMGFMSRCADEFENRRYVE